MRIRVKDVLDMLAGARRKQKSSPIFRICKKKIFVPPSLTLPAILTTQCWSGREEAIHY
jgi:hypothetical protein